MPSCGKKIIAALVTLVVTTDVALSLENTGPHKVASIQKEDDVNGVPHIYFYFYDSKSAAEISSKLCQASAVKIERSHKELITRQSSLYLKGVERWQDGVQPQIIDLNADYSILKQLAERAKAVTMFQDKEARIYHLGSPLLIVNEYNKPSREETGRALELFRVDMTPCLPKFMAKYSCSHERLVTFNCIGTALANCVDSPVPFSAYEGFGDLINRGILRPVKGETSNLHTISTYECFDERSGKVLKVLHAFVQIPFTDWVFTKNGSLGETPLFMKRENMDRIKWGDCKYTLRVKQYEPDQRESFCEQVNRFGTTEYQVHALYEKERRRQGERFNPYYRPSYDPNFDGYDISEGAFKSIHSSRPLQP